MDEINEAAPSSTEPVAVNLADLAALSVANMVAQQVSTPFIDQIAIGSTPQPAGELPNVSPSPTGTPDASMTSATSGSAHEAVNALDRFMERISNDFAREGKALVDAMRAEISKLVP